MSTDAEAPPLFLALSDAGAVIAGAWVFYVAVSSSAGGPRLVA